jgi:hypothetical protein
VKNIARLVLVGLAGTAAALAGALPASAAAQRDFFVVETQFQTAPSPIVDAGGAFAGCTSVSELGGLGEQFTPNRVIFIGDKLIQCAGGDVVIHYNATINVSSSKKTYGHWFVVESTLPGITAGFGTVRGDSSRCQVAEGSGGCILDVFSGRTE